MSMNAGSPLVVVGVGGMTADSGSILIKIAVVVDINSNINSYG